MSYGYNPERFVKDYSYIADVGKSLGGLISHIPKIIQDDEEYKITKQNAESVDSANNQAFQEMQKAAQAFGLDPNIITKPQIRQNTDEYTSKEITNLLTAAQGVGIDKQTMLEKITQLSGAGLVPGVEQEQHILDKLKQQQQGINVRTDEYGQTQQQPQEQVQHDIQNITGGAKPSLLDSLNSAQANFGQSNVTTPLNLKTPQQPNDMLRGLQIQQPFEQDVSPLRQQALDAGMSGNELDLLLSDLKSGNIGIADFDEKIAKTQNAHAKRLAAERKLKEEKIKNQRDVLQKSIGKVPIYLNDEQAKMIDPNIDPFDYKIGTDPIQKKTTVEYTGTGRGGATQYKIDKGKTLRQLYGERSRLQKQKNDLVKARDLNPRMYEIGSIRGDAMQKEMDNINRMLGDIEGNINQVQKSDQIKPDKMKDVKYRDIPTNELIRKLKEKRPNATEEQIQAFLKKIGKIQ